MYREQSGKVYIISRRGWIMLCVLVYIKQNGETQIKIGQNRQMKKSGGLTGLEHVREGGVGAASVGGTTGRRPGSAGGGNSIAFNGSRQGAPRGAAGASRKEHWSIYNY